MSLFTIFLPLIFSVFNTLAEFLLAQLNHFYSGILQIFFGFNLGRRFASTSSANDSRRALSLSKGNPITVARIMNRRMLGQDEESVSDSRITALSR
jgi:hypothetical protein